MFNDLSHCFLNCAPMTIKDLWLRKFWEMLPAAPWRLMVHICNSKGSQRSCSRLKKTQQKPTWVWLGHSFSKLSDDELLFSQRNINFQNSCFQEYDVVLVWTWGPGCPCEVGISPPPRQGRGPSLGYMCCVPPPLPVWAYAVFPLTPVNKSV